VDLDVFALIGKRDFAQKKRDRLYSFFEGFWGCKWLIKAGFEQDERYLEDAIYYCAGKAD
jgi:hypothetical protein